jgi:molecular chaperone GrpE
MEEEKKKNIENIELTIEERLNESEDKYLRLYAEFENYKKRINKQKEDLETKSKMLSSILDMDSDISIAFKTIENEDAKKRCVTNCQ